MLKKTDNKPKKVYYQKKERQEKICQWCQKTFMAKKYNAKACSPNCSSKLSQALSRENWRKKGIRRDLVQISVVDDKKLIKDVEAFIVRIKKQHYSVNYVDCFILVDLYDRVFPKLENVPFRRDIERSIREMFIRISKWLLLKNNKALI